MNLTTRGMVAAEVSLPEVKKVDVTSWKCHRLPWNCGEKVLPEQLVIACTQIQGVDNLQQKVLYFDTDSMLYARYGRCKELWTKGAAGTGSVDQQAVERHW